MEVVCKKTYQCKGNCWLNVAGSFNVWEIVSSHCKGTKREQDAISRIFHGEEDKEAMLKLYDFTKCEKDAVMGSWH